MANNFLVDKIETNLLELMRSKQFKTGDVLPKEVELASTLGVSRSVIREALSRLKAKGLIESRKKKGAMLIQPDTFCLVAEKMNPDLMAPDTLREIYEIRLALEVGMADFIIKNATAHDIQSLKTIVAKEETKAPTQMLGFELQTELDFHGKLFEISGNQTLYGFLLKLLPIFSYVLSSNMFKTPPPFKKLVTHRDLIEIIETGSAEKLRKGMRQHLNSHYKRLFLAPPL